MSRLDDPFEPEDTIPGTQPGERPTDLPLPQVAEVAPGQLQNPGQLPQEQLVQPETPATQVAQAPPPAGPQPQQYAPDGTPLPYGTQWGRAAGAGPGGPYSRPVTGGQAPAWMGDQAWQVLGFQRERVPGSERQGYTPPYVPPRERPSDPMSPATPNGLDSFQAPDPLATARDFEQSLSPRTASSRNVGFLHSLFNATMDPYLRTTGADIPRGLQVITGQQGGILGDAADAVDNWIADNFQINPEYRDNIFVGTIAPILGNLLGIATTIFLTAGMGTGAAIAARGIGLTGRAVAATAGAAGAVSARTGLLASAAATVGIRNPTQAVGAVGGFFAGTFPQNAAQQYRDALQNGANWDDIIAASRYNGVVGGIMDLLPVERAFSRVDASMGNVIQRSIQRAIGNGGYRIAETGFSEMLTESAQQIFSNLVASNIVAYDPNRDMFEGVGDNAIGGFSAGSIMQLVMNMLPGGRRVHNPNNLPPSALFGGRVGTGGPGGAPPGGWGSAQGGTFMGGTPGPGFPGGPGAPGAQPGLPGPGGQGPSGPGAGGQGPNIDGFGQAPTGIEGHEDAYFALPTRTDRTEFLRGQQDRIRELDAAWKKDRPDYVGDPIVGASLEFYNYLTRSEADFERLRNLPPERAAQPDIQARMREMEANREVIDLMMDPVRMVNRPVWILQRPGKGKQGGQSIQIATDDKGQPIRRTGARERVVGVDGKDYFVGSSQLMQVDNVAPENVVLSPQGQNIIRLARMRMAAETTAREAQTRADAQERTDTATGRNIRGQRDPRAATPAPAGTQYGLNIQREGDTAQTPEQQAAAQAANEARTRASNPQSELFTTTDSNSVKPDASPSNVAHEPLKPPALTEQEQLELDGLTQTSGQQAAASKRSSATGAAAMATLVPKRVVLEDLPGDIRQKMDMAAIRSGVKLPETFNEQELIDAGLSPADAGNFFRQIDLADTLAATQRRARETPREIKRGVKGIMEFFADLPRRERRAMRKMLRHFERHIGPMLSDLDVIDFAKWSAAADATLAEQGKKPQNFNDPNVAAAYMQGRVRALGDSMTRAAIALRAENATSASRAKAITRVSHELTHFMISLTGHTNEDLARLWDKLTLNMSSDPAYQEVVRLYAGDPPSVLANEFLAKKVETAMSGRYETAFAKLQPGEDPSLRTYISEFIRRALQFVADVYDWILGRDIINTLFGDISKTLQVNLETYSLQHTELDPYSDEDYTEITDDEFRAMKESGDANSAQVRDAALGYFVVLYKGDRARVEQAMSDELDKSWVNLPADLRDEAYRAAVIRTEGYTDLKLAYQKGVLIGAPNNPRAFTELFRLARKGEGANDGKGKFWYEITAEQFLGQFGLNAQAFLRYLAVTSPQNRVGPNTGQGINAFTQALMRPHAKIGAYPELGITGVGTPSVTKMANDLKETGKWSPTATKTQTFYRDLAEDLDLSGEDYAGTVDRWMMRAFGFNSDNPTPGQYIHARLIMRTMADALGWKVKWVQAAIWCAIKLESKNPLDWDTRNYGDFLRLAKGQMNFEIRPSDNFKTGAMFASLGRQDQEQITAIVVTQIWPDLLRTLNIQDLNPLFNVGHGGYLGSQSPSIETRVPMPDWAINAMSAAIGHVFRQDAVLVTRIQGYGAYIKNPTSFTAITFTEQTDVSPDDAKRLWDHMIKVDPKLHGGYALQGNKMLFFNLQSDVPGALSKLPLSKLTDNEFNLAIEAALKTYPTNVALDVSPPGEAEARLIENDWKANPNGESYTEALERIRPGLADNIHALRARADSILASEFSKRGLEIPAAGPVNTIGRPVTAPIPVGGPVDVRDGSPRTPATKDQLQGAPDLNEPLAGVDPGAFAQKQIYERYGVFQPGIDTTQQLKVYPLDLLVSEPERVNAMLRTYRAVMKEFAYEAEPGVEVVLPRLAKDGYANGTIWIYNPKVANASFKDEHYTRAWRAAHELAHGITEALIQKKYGKSRRHARLGRSMMVPIGKGDKAIMVQADALTLREAMRAVEWEDVAFRVQQMLLKEMGVEISDAQFAQEYNINISDAVYRTVTGEFGTPGDYGFVPATDKKGIQETLYLLEQYEDAIAREQQRDPTVGYPMTQWEEIPDADLEAILAQARETGLASVAVQRNDDFPGEKFTDIDPGRAQELFSSQAYVNLRAAIYNASIQGGDPSQWRAELRKAKVPFDELRWSGMLDWLVRRSAQRSGGPITRNMMQNFINAAEVMLDGSDPGKLVLRSNPSDPTKVEVEVEYEPRQDEKGRLLYHITKVTTTGGRERTLLMLRRATRWAVESGFHGVSWAGDTIQQKDPNWRKNGDYVARDLPSGATFRARLVPRTGTAFINMIYLPQDTRGTGVGKGIVEQFERTAAEHGVRRVEGHALPVSIPFWQSQNYVVSPNENADGLHPMTKFIGPTDPENTVPMRESSLTPDQAAAAVAKNFDAKIERTRIAQPSEAQTARRTPPSAVEEHAPNYQTGKALIFNDAMTQSVDDDAGEIYFSRIRVNVPPHFKPSPVSPNWPKFWQKHGRFLRMLDVFVAQSSKRIRALMGQTAAAFEMGNHFRRDIWAYTAPGLKGQISEDYHGVVQGMLGKLMTPLADKISEIQRTYPKAVRNLALVEIATALRGSNINPATGRVQLTHLQPADARWFRGWLNDVVDFTNRHMQGQTAWGPGNGTQYGNFATGPASGKTDYINSLPNYFPQIWNLHGNFGDGPFKGKSIAAVAHEFFKGLNFFPQHQNRDKKIAGMIGHIMGEDGFVSYAATNTWRPGSVTNLSPGTRERVISIDPNISVPVTVGGVTANVTLDDFLDNNPLTILPRYAIGMARHGEFVRRFGPKGEEIDRLIHLNDNQRQAAGMSPLAGEELKTVIYQIHGNLHAHQKSFGHLANEGTALFKMLANTNMLFFTALMSIPEVMMQGVRMGMRGQYYALLAGLKQIGSTITRQGDTEARRMAKDLGIIRDHFQQTILDYSTNQSAFSIFGKTPDEWSNTLFKRTAVDAWTNFGRTMAVAAAIRVLPHWGEKAAAGSQSHQHKLLRVGLVYQDLRGFNPNNYLVGQNVKIDGAIRQLAQEVIIAPTPGMLPGWMSDPRFRLVAHIKSFMIGFGNTALQHVAVELANYNPMPLIWTTAYAALAAVHAAIWEATVYGPQGNPSWRRAGLADSPKTQFALNMISRGGLAMPLQLFVDAVAMNRTAQGGSFMGGLVPAAAVADRLWNFGTGLTRWMATGFDNPAALHQVISSASLLIPGFSQMGGFRQWAVDAIAPTPSRPPAPMPYASTPPHPRASGQHGTGHGGAPYTGSGGGGRGPYTGGGTGGRGPYTGSTR